MRFIGTTNTGALLKSARSPTSRRLGGHSLRLYSAIRSSRESELRGNPTTYQGLLLRVRSLLGLFFFRFFTSCLTLTGCLASLQYCFWCQSKWLQTRLIWQQVRSTTAIAHFRSGT